MQIRSLWGARAWQGDREAAARSGRELPESCEFWGVWGDWMGKSKHHKPTIYVGCSEILRTSANLGRVTESKKINYQYSTLYSVFQCAMRIVCQLQRQFSKLNHLFDSFTKQSTFIAIKSSNKISENLSNSVIRIWL